MLPFDCREYAAVLKYNKDKSVLIAQVHNYCRLNIYAHYMLPGIERIIWIAFYKNHKNNKCLIKNLPKDLIHCILHLLGKEPMVAPYIKITV